MRRGFVPVLYLLLLYQKRQSDEDRMADPKNVPGGGFSVVLR